jgi:hypothetical protein
MKTTTLLNVLAAAAVVFAVAGCKSEQKPKLSINDHFVPDDQPRAMHEMFRQQQANAARDDGTLYASHFTGGELNSLGKQKLDVMLVGPERGFVNVYLSVPKDAQYGAREASVIAFMAGKGLASNAFAVTPGENPNLSSPASAGLEGLKKQAESGGGDAGASGGSGAAK